MNKDDYKQRFEKCWQSGKPPFLEDFIPSNLEGKEWSDFVAELVGIDLKQRLLLGQEPDAKYYAQYSSEIRAIAENCIDRQSETSITKSVPVPPDDDTFQLEGTQVEEELPPLAPLTRGTWLGAYELIRPIGKGGMGTVWEAIQHEPVHRRVAIKLTRGDIESEFAATRFDLECQAIARMEHPNIAQILDAGKSAGGHSYLVMELVHGIPFDKYCDTHKLTINERLSLMLPVCKAIQHAHQKGIIHRDLKHSNVLISEVDGEPVPKVIDFGLAKSQDISLEGDETVVTHIGQVVGTLQYMSPEQAEGNHVDTRTDIYALGVMLYKLVTGTTPLNLTSLSSQTFVRVVEAVRSFEAPKPSARLDSNSNKLDAISDLRSTRPEKLRQSVRGDLDWIVMTAIAKDSDLRYETAQELGLEINRYLNHEEVAARPPSRSYRLGKFVRRNKNLFTFAASATVLLIAGVIGTSYGLYRALRATEVAKQNEDKAIVEAENARLAENEAEAQLYALRVQTAWNNWQLGKVESAWTTLSECGSSGWEARFLHSEFNTNLQTLHGHAGNATEIVVASDSKTFYTAGVDHLVHVWQMDLLGEPQEKWQRLRLDGKPSDTTNIDGDSSWPIPGVATCLVISPDDKLLACADRSNFVTVFDLESGSQLSQLGPFEKDIQSLEFFPADSFPETRCNWLLATGESDRDSFRDQLDWGYGPRTPAKISLLEPSSGHPVLELPTINSSINVLLCSQAGDFLVCGCEDGKIIKWEILDSVTRKLLDVPRRLELARHSKAVRDLSFSPSSNLLASCSDDRIVRLQNLQGKVSRDFTGHSEAVTGVDFSANGQRLVTCSEDGTLKTWGIEGNSETTFRGHYASVNAVRFRRDKEEFISVSNDSTVRWWSARERYSTRTTRPFKKILWQAAFSPDGKRIACASEDYTIKILSTEDGTSLAELQRDTEQLCIAFSPTGDRVACGGVSGAIEIRRADNLELIESIPNAHQGYIWDIQYSPDGSSIITAGAENAAKIWSTDNLELRGSLTGHGAEVGSARYSPDGKLIVTAGDDKLVKLWSAEDLGHLHTFDSLEHEAWRAVFSPCGRYVASSGYVGELVLWDVEKRSRARKFIGHSDQIAGLTFSVDGDRLVSASDDGTIRFWEVETGIPLITLRDQGDRPIVHVSFSADGSQLASGNSAGQLTIRHSADVHETTPPYLPSNALSFCSKAMQLLTENELSHQEMVALESEATKCCGKFPSYLAWTVCGIARYRLNDHSAAKSALLSAERLEPIEYGEPDVRPYIEGFLAMVHHKLSLHEDADAFLHKFKVKRNRQIWKFDTQVALLDSELERTLSVHPTR